MSYKLVIPARLRSERLPEKALADVGGKALIVRVWQAAMKSRADEVIVAVDDERIAEVVRAEGGVAELTSVEHASGTDRIAEIAERHRWGAETIVVNLQGDEPLIDPALLDALADDLASRAGCAMATVATPIAASEELRASSVVKVVLRDDARALYFSRAAIPFVRGEVADVPFLRHLGLYAYRVDALLGLARSPRAAIERAESLEQLRALALGYDIFVRVIEAAPPPGIDIAADLRRLREGWGR